MENNIFKYATSELSQDAVICWCVNWINHKNSALYPMASEILMLLGVKENLGDIELEIYRQKFNIDILLSLKGQNKMIIIEDKIYSSEHHDQINKYREEILNMSLDEKKDYEIDDNVDITTVYFKTGFFYDYDKKVKADIVVSGEDFLAIIERYRGKNEILDSYYEYLEENLNWYTKFGRYDNIGEKTDFSDWNISNHQIAQYKMMREIFPEYKWDKTSRLYEVRHGTNKGGRPWTELDIMKGLVGKTNGGYTIFWRIDTNIKGPYISLRFYDKYNKKDEQEKQEHINTYNKHRDQIEKIITTENITDWQWEALKGGYTANYYEATLMTFYLKDTLRNWSTESEQVIQNIRNITECFITINEKE